MKIRISELRNIIRKIVSEESDVPGRWRASSGEPVDGDDLDRLGHKGSLGEGDYVDEDENASLEDRAHDAKTEAKYLAMDMDRQHDYPALVAAYKKAADLYEELAEERKQAGNEKGAQYARLEARDMRREEEKFSKAKVYKSAFASYKDVKNKPVY